MDELVETVIAQNTNKDWTVKMFAHFF